MCVEVERIFHVTYTFQQMYDALEFIGYSRKAVSLLNRVKLTHHHKILN